MNSANAGGYRLWIPSPSNISIGVYNILGKRVRMLEQGYRASGEHKVGIDGTGLSNGIYFVRLTAGNFSQTRKMVVAK
ncbi:MAG: hypothetical protein BMS9Abin05_1199 [Rhodothermia bacterium]|nr:MAG: hypothetical protein BMS9Abin05_1199 [Rhodothermia bacterium]